MTPIQYLIQQLKQRYTTVEKARQWFAAILRGEITVHTGDPYLNSDPTELLTAVFNAVPGDIPSHARQALGSVIKSARNELVELFEKIADGDTPTGEQVALLSRWASIMTRAHPEDLRYVAESLFIVAQQVSVCEPDLAFEVFSAFGAFSQSEDDMDRWEKLLENPEFAAFAFNTMARIQPRSDRVEKALWKLWANQTSNTDWPINTVLLTKSYLERLEQIGEGPSFQQAVGRLARQQDGLLLHIMQSLEDQAKSGPDLLRETAKQLIDVFNVPTPKPMRLSKPYETLTKPSKFAHIEPIKPQIPSGALLVRTAITAQPVTLSGGRIIRTHSAYGLYVATDLVDAAEEIPQSQNIGAIVRSVLALPYGQELKAPVRDQRLHLGDVFEISQQG